MAEKQKFPEGEHADLHLDAEEQVIDAAINEGEVAETPESPMDTTAAIYDDDDEDYDCTCDAEDAKLAALVVGLVFAVITCIVAIILGRKLADKE